MSYTNYPVRLQVLVSFPEWPDMPPFVDFMGGLNTGHAMWRARQNWDDATIQPVASTRTVKR